MFKSVLVVSGTPTDKLDDLRISQSRPDVVEIDGSLSKAKGEIQLIDQGSITLDVIADAYDLYSSVSYRTYRHL